MQPNSLSPAILHTILLSSYVCMVLYDGNARSSYFLVQLSQWAWPSGHCGACIATWHWLGFFTFCPGLPSSAAIQQGTSETYIHNIYSTRKNSSTTHRLISQTIKIFRKAQKAPGSSAPDATVRVIERNLAGVQKFLSAWGLAKSVYNIKNTHGEITPGYN